MTFSKKPHETYWKQAESGLISHVYEHIATQQVDTYMHSKQHYFLASYDLWGNTYGTSCFPEVPPH